jgi:hypothetical protein
MITLKSRFKFLPILLVSILSFFPFLAIYIYVISPKQSLAFPLVIFIIIAYFWLTIFRTRAHKVEILDNTIIVKRYFGVGKPMSYDFNSLDGFITLFESAKGGSYESIFILKEGKRIGSISSFYHSNFNNLKLVLKGNLTDLGEIKGHDNISDFLKKS